MENDTSILILLIIFVLLLIIAQLTVFFTGFSRKLRYLRMEMRRAAHEEEYRAWRRELRCCYLCLIPFVTERNVSRVYARLFHRAKHAAKRKHSDSLVRILAPSLIGAFVCAVCLCGASWAWFTASTMTGTTAIRSAAFALDTVQVSENSSENTAILPDETGKYQLAAGKQYTVSLRRSADSTATAGFCCIAIAKGEKSSATPYYTAAVGSDADYTVILRADEPITVSVEPIWGDVSKQRPGYTPVQDGDTIVVGSAEAIRAAAASEPTAQPEETSADAQPDEPEESAAGSVSAEGELSLFSETEEDTDPADP